MEKDAGESYPKGTDPRVRLPPEGGWTSGLGEELGDEGDSAVGRTNPSGPPRYSSRSRMIFAAFSMDSLLLRPPALLRCGITASGVSPG